MEENKLFNWLRKHLSKLTMALICLAALGVFLDKNLSSKKSNAKKDFIAIHTLFDRVLAGELLSLEGIETAETILANHPELHPKYDSLLALCLFQQENSAKGIFYSDAALQRIEKLSSSPYNTFGKVSLLIAKKNYSEALAQSDQLEEFVKEQPSLETLRAFNLLRLAFLAKELHQLPLSKQAWSRLQALPTFPLISSLFEEGTFTLADYFKGKE